MKVIYVAGKFRAPTHYEIQKNIRRAEAAALEIWKLGAVALCPHLNTANFQCLLDDKVWIDGGMELMLRCDAVFLVVGWECSLGAQAEVAEAKLRGLPVFDNYMRLGGWLKEFAEQIAN